MNSDPRITKQKAALRATRDLLTYWAGPPEVALNEKLPADLQQAADLLDAISGADVLRLVVSNRALLSSLIR